MTPVKKTVGVYDRPKKQRVISRSALIAVAVAITAVLCVAAVFFL